MNTSGKIHAWVVNAFSALSRCAIRHPRRVLLVAVLVTLVAAPGLWRLKLRTDGHALVDASAPEVVFDEQVRDEFGIEDQLVVLIRSPHTNGIFNPGTLQLVRDLTADFQKLPGINPANILSLATEPGLRQRQGTVYHWPLLEPPLETPAQLDRLREDLRLIGLYTGTLVSFDGQCACILIGTPMDGNRTRLYQRVLEAIAARGAVPEEISATGAPAAEALLGLHILEDLGVPPSLLGASARSHRAQAEWKIPATLREFREFIARRIGLLLVAVAAMLLVFLLCFRNATATVLPLPEVAATLVFVFGLMGWLGVPIYLTIAVMPVLLTAMCVTDEIHIFSRYFALLREQPHADHVALVRQTMGEMVCPVGNTTLTTAIGFVSFAFSPLAPVQAFGIFTALGVLFSLFYSLTVIPAMLVLINPAWLVPRRQAGSETGSRLGTWMARAALAIARHRWWAVGAVALVLVLVPFGLRRVVVQDSWIDGFAPESQFRRATELVNEQFHGMHLLQVVSEPPSVLRGEIPAAAVSPGRILLPGHLADDPMLLPGNWITLTPAVGTGAVWRTQILMASRAKTNLAAVIANSPADRAASEALAAGNTLRFELTDRPQHRPETIHDLAQFAAFLREQRSCDVGGVLGPAEYLSTTRFMARGGDEAWRGLPVSAGETRLTWDYYRVQLGPERLRQIVDTNFQQSLTTVFLRDANFVNTAKLMAVIRDYEREHLAPRGVKLGFAGDVAVSQSLIRGIVTTQMQSLLGSLAGICLTTALLCRSLRRGLLCVLPSALAVLVNFAVMGWCGIPLGVATSMFAGMTLGIGVDFAIHLIETFEQAMRNGASPADALARAMTLSGPPVFINTLAISLGFGVLVFSQVPANARLGLLTVLALVNCLLATLLILPGLLRWTQAKESRAATAGTPSRVGTGRS